VGLHNKNLLGSLEPNIITSGRALAKTKHFVGVAGVKSEAWGATATRAPTGYAQSKMAACNRNWKFVVIYTTNLPQILTWKNIRISPVMMLDAKNIYNKYIR